MITLPLRAFGALHDSVIAHSLDPCLAQSKYYISFAIIITKNLLCTGYFEAAGIYK